MAIVSGYQKMKDYIKQSSGYKLLSRWANANTLECDDGKTLQNKVGGISGISSSLTANSTTQAASTNLTNQLYQNITQVSSELAAMNDNGLITGLEVREGDGVYITYQDGADTVSKKLGNPSKLSFDISGSGDNPNYLSSATFQFHRTSFDGFLNAGYTKCKITFISFSGAQSTGRLDIRKNGVVSTYYTNPGTVEFELEEGDYIAGYVSEQRTFRFSATVTMLC